MDTTRFVLGVLLIVGLPPAICYWLLIHPFVDFWRKIGPRATLFLVGALSLLVGWAVYLFRHTLLGRDLGTSWILVGMGVLLYGVSAWISVLTKRQLAVRTLAGLPELSLQGSEDTLLQEGVYGVIRHPRYVSVIIGTAGFAMVVNHVGAYLVVLGTIPALYLVVIFEERELLGRFGSAYQKYRSQVPAFFPKTWKGETPRHP